MSVNFTVPIAFNAPAAGVLLDPLRDLFGSGDIGRGLAGFAESVGAPRSLQDIGMKEADLGRAADLALSAPYWNPRPFNRDEILRLLHAAWAGDAPGPADP